MPSLLNLARRYERRRRFWRLVEVHGPRDCWPWRGPLDASGCGRHRGRPADARAFELAKGPLARGTRPHHDCGDPSCVNPLHLEVPG